MSACLASRRQAYASARPERPGYSKACPGARVVALGPEDWLLEDRKMRPDRADSNTGCSLNAKPGTLEELEPSITLYPYVHLDALPLTHVGGVEDPEAWKLERLWAFAWDEAKAFGALKQARLLSANPPQWRSQDHLHVHVTAITNEALRRLLHPESDREPASRVPPEHVDALSVPGRPSPVWAAARANARALARKLGWTGGLESGRFGVAVAYDPAAGKFAVAAIAGSPEREYARLCIPDLGRQQAGSVPQQPPLTRR